MKNERKEQLQPHQQEDLQKFSELYKQYYERVYRFVSMKLSDREAADMTQQVFLKAMLYWHTFRHEASSITWLIQIAKNSIKNEYRRRSRHKENGLDFRKHQHLFTFPDFSRNSEMRIDLKQALQQLPERDQEIIILRFFVECTFKEIADSLHMGESAVKNRLYRSMQKLKALFQGGETLSVQKIVSLVNQYYKQAKIDMEVLAKQAQLLHQFHRQAKKEACTRIRSSLPHFSKATDEQILASPFSLSDARLVIAREYGFSDWSQIKQFARSLAVNDSPVNRLSATSANLTYCQEKAEELLQKLQTGSVESALRIKAYVPQYQHQSIMDILNATVSLADAQLVISQEYGFSDWKKLKNQIQFMRQLDEHDEQVEQAIRAIDAHDLHTLTALLNQNPALVNAGGGVLLDRVAQPEGGDEKKALPLLQALIHAGALVDRSLIIAACFNRTLIVQALLEAGANIRATLEWNLTALESALLHGSQEAADLLSEIALTRDTLWVAAGSGRLDHVRNWFTSDGLLKPEAGSHRPNFADVGHPPGLPKRDDPQEIIEEAFIIACLNGRVEVVNFFLSLGVNINARPYRQLTGLHFAAWFNKVDMVRFLIEKGADPTIKDETYQSTPLGYAKACQRDYVIQLLEEM